MAIEGVVESLGLAAVVTLGWWEVARVEARDALRRRTARARPQPCERERCPYCHGDFAQDEPGRCRVRCARCGTEHHADCWVDHARCSVFGCGEAEIRPAHGAQAPAPGRETAAQAFEVEPGGLADLEASAARGAPRERVGNPGE